MTNITKKRITIKITLKYIIDALRSARLSFYFPYLIFKNYWHGKQIEDTKRELLKVSEICHDKGEGGDNRTMEAGTFVNDKSNIRAYENDYYLHKYASNYFGRNVQSSAMISVLPVGKSSGGGWHVDSVRPGIKALMYLSDVNASNGPFSMLMNYRDGYVQHNSDKRKTRYDDTTIFNQLKLGATIHTLTAGAGTVIVFDTSHIHRGVPLKLGIRMSITNYYDNRIRSRCKY